MTKLKAVGTLLLVIVAFPFLVLAGNLYLTYGLLKGICDIVRSLFK